MQKRHAEREQDQTRHQEAETQLQCELEEAHLNQPLGNVFANTPQCQEAESHLKSELEEAHLNLTKLTQ